MTSDATIRVTDAVKQADEWSLVLAAAGIAHRIVPHGADWAVVVSAEHAAPAQATLDAYDAEARPVLEAPVRGAVTAPIAWTIGIASAALLLLFFDVTGPPVPGSHWFERGAASARLIVGGEPWRAVTALTLHVDVIHALGNALATAVLLAAVVEQVGPGVGVLVVLAAGAIGNVLAAMAQDPGHVAVGASTTVFGALGVLAALRLFTPPTGRPPRWAVLVAAVVLLALLGTGRGADVVAHGMGFLSGGALGAIVRTTVRRPLGPLVQAALAALAVLAVAVSWRLALA